VVLTVWDGLPEVLARAGDGLAGHVLNFDQIDADCELAAREQAGEGVNRARAAGLDARPSVVERSGPVWETILQQAGNVQADVIVLGSRGLSGLQSVLLGSVSQRVLQQADRPVLVVRAASAALQRSVRVGHEPATAT
jgi:nucleotide-binding universal stress UspA family protein